MAVIVIPSRWQRQPTGPVEIDWNHGMAADLIGAFVGGLDVDLTQPNAAPIYTNTATAEQQHVGTEYGVARRVGGVSGHVYWQVQRRGVNSETSGLTAWGRVCPLVNPSNHYFTLARTNFSRSFGWSYEVTTRRLSAYMRADSGGTAYTIPGSRVISAFDWHDAGSVLAGTTLSLYDGGEFSVSGTVANGTTPTRFSLGDSSMGAFLVPVCYLWAGAHPEYMQELSRNPWQLLKRRIYKFISLGGGAAADLESDATGSGSAAGDLTTAIQLVGAAVATGAAAGDLATAVQLAGAAAAAAGASGALSTGIPLAGAAASVTLSGGSLTTQIRLDGAALASALASGTLDSGSAALTGDAHAAGAAAGGLTTIIVLQGAAVGGALAAADLTAPGTGLSGAATAAALASGALTTQIPLAGGAQATVIATGAASTSISLAGAAVGVVAATGDLVVALGLSGDAVAAALVGASLTTSVTLRADAVAGAQAGGSLAGVIYIASARRTARVAARVRVAAVARRVRTQRVGVFA